MLESRLISCSWDLSIHTINWRVKDYFITIFTIYSRNLADKLSFIVSIQTTHYQKSHSAYIMYSGFFFRTRSAIFQQFFVLNHLSFQIKESYSLLIISNVNVAHFTKGLTFYEPIHDDWYILWNWFLRHLSWSNYFVWFEKLYPGPMTINWEYS